MTDLFNEKAKDWDSNSLVAELSSAVGAAIVEHVALNSHMQVMDFGAGTGLISGHISPLVKKITALDISETMLKKLIAKPELQGKVEAICQDIIEQPLTLEFDLIVSAMAMHHVEDTATLLQRFNQHLKPGGMIALADLDKEDGSFHPENIQGVFHSGFERAELQSTLLKNGFENIHFYTAHTIQKENRQYPVFLVVARKK